MAAQPSKSTAPVVSANGPTTNQQDPDGKTILVQDTATADPRQVPVATVANVRYRDGYAPGDVAKETLYQRLDGKVVSSADAGSEDGFRGTVLVSAGDSVSAGAARTLAAEK